MSDTPQPRYVYPVTIKQSPWGKVQVQYNYADGVDCVSTAGHGGLKLDRKHNAMIPKIFRRQGGWYEEDLDCCIVIYFLPQCWPTWASKKEDVEKTLKNWFPKEWEAHTGTVLQPGESREKDEENWKEQHKNDFVVRSAMYDQKDRTKVNVCAVKTATGEERWFVVPDAEYGNRERFGFVIDEARHPRKETEGFYN